MTTATLTEPGLEFQTAVRAQLIATPAIMGLVSETSIRAGGSRPTAFPCIRLGNGTTDYLGRSGAQHFARVNLDLHVWAEQDGSAKDRILAHHVAHAILGLPVQHPSFYLVEPIPFPSAVWTSHERDGQFYDHGVLEVEAAIGWAA